MQRPVDWEGGALGAPWCWSGCDAPGGIWVSAPPQYPTFLAGFRICSHRGSGAFQKAGTTHRILLSLLGRFVFPESPCCYPKVWNLSTVPFVHPGSDEFGSFGSVLGTAGAQIGAQNSRNWSAAMATGNTESGLAIQWLKMHVWESYFIVNNCSVCWHINASIQITFSVSPRLGFMCN